MSRVGWDLDGVGYDFKASVLRYFDSIGLTVPKIEEDDVKWDFFTFWGMTKEDFAQHCHDGADAGFIFGGKEQREGFAEATQLTHMLGHVNVVITDRSFGKTPAVSEQLTRNWLRDVGAIYDELHFGPDKTMVPTDTFVEDKLANYDALDAVGTEVYLIDRPWNQDPGDSRRRIESVSEYANIIYKRTPLLVIG